MFYVTETSRYLPGPAISNDELTQFPERFRGLIGEKAGVYSRHHAQETQCTSDLGAQAVTNLLNKTGLSPDVIDGLICATSSPDRIQPATATRIQQLCGLTKAFAFDVNSVCAGSIFAMATADALMNNGYEHIIVVASEVYSKILNPTDLRSFPYFGDGAGAALIGKKGKLKIEGFILGSDGAGADLIQIPAGGTLIPFSKLQNKSDIYFKMNGQAVYSFACNKAPEILSQLLTDYSVKPTNIVAHQANINILREISLRSNIPFEKFFINVDRIGNTAGASTLIALDECLETRQEQGDILLLAFGGGLSWGGACLRCINPSTP